MEQVPSAENPADLFTKPLPHLPPSSSIPRHQVRLIRVWGSIELYPESHRAITLCQLLPFLGPWESGNATGQWPGQLCG